MQNKMLPCCWLLWDCRNRFLPNVPHSIFYFSPSFFNAIFCHCMLPFFFHGLHILGVGRSLLLPSFRSSSCSFIQFASLFVSKNLFLSLRPIVLLIKFLAPMGLGLTFFKFPILMGFKRKKRIIFVIPEKHNTRSIIIMMDDERRGEEEQSQLDQQMVFCLRPCANDGIRKTTEIIL